MIIKKLEITGFGKFHHKTIELTDGLNIVYGSNEAGKSTLFHFIVAMFYGFYKPSTKKRLLRDEYERFKPWVGESYGGSLTFVDDNNRELKIERNFMANSSWVKVYVVKTGEEITGTYPIHPVFRMADIADVHLGISYTAFVGTLAIGQEQIKTDGDMEGEIKEKLVNGLGAKHVDVSVSKINQKLDKKLEAIGTLRKKTSNYSLKQKELEALLTEQKESLKAQDEVKRLLRDEEVEQEKLEVLYAKEKALKRQKLEEEYIRLRNRIKKVKAIESKCDELKVELRMLEGVNVTDKSGNLQLIYSVDEINKGLEIFRELEFNLEDTTRLESRQEEINNRKTEDQMVGLTEPNPYVVRDNRRWISLFPIVVVLIGFVLIALDFMVMDEKLSGMFYGGVVLAGLGVAAWFGASRFVHEMEVYDQAKEIAISNLKASMEKLKNDEKEVTIQLVESAKKRVELEEQLTPIIKELKVTTPGELKKIKDGSMVFEEKSIYLSRLYREQEMLLQGEELGVVTKRSQELELRLDSFAPIVETDGEIESDQLHEKIKSARDYIAALGARRLSVERNHRTLAVLAEQIAGVKEELKEMDFDRKVFEQVKETIEKVTLDLRRNFAPALNRHAGEMIEKVSGEKYSDIKITPELTINLYDPESLRTVQADDLSKGTVDLFYFALRESLARWISEEKKLPLIMDETFAGFDDRRLEKVVEVLEGKEGQMLLFTCQNREVEMVSDKAVVIRL